MKELEKNKDRLYYHPESESYFWDTYDAGSDINVVDVTDVPSHRERALAYGAVEPEQLKETTCGKLKGAL